MRVTGRLVEAFTQALPFPLTGAQARTVSEIREDMVCDKRMLRLPPGLMSGRARPWSACSPWQSAVEAGRQAAMMAPTEILARQHFERLKPWWKRRACASRSPPGAKGKRTPCRARSARRRQHRHRHRHACAVSGERHLQGSRPRVGRRTAPFRRAFSAWRSAPRARRWMCSSLTATPIRAHAGAGPFRRYGHLRPRRKTRRAQAHRHQAESRSNAWAKSSAASGGRLMAARGFTGGGLPAGRRNPRALDLAAAQERAEDLRRIYGEAVGLVHGKLSGPEKDAAMERFRSPARRRSWSPPR